MDSDASHAASSMTSAGLRRRRRRRARTPNGSVSVAPVVCPDGRPNSTGPGKSRMQLATTSRAAACRPARRSSGSSPNTTRRRAREEPAQPQLREHPIEPVRPLADFVEEQHAPGGGSNAYGVPSDAVSCVSVPPTSIPVGLAGLQDLELSDATISPDRLGAAEAAQERVAIVAGLALRQPSLDHRPVKRHDAAASASARSGSRCCRCSR